MNRYIQLNVTVDNGQPVSRTVLRKASDIVQVLDKTTYREVTYWDEVNQKEVVIQVSDSLAAIQYQTSAALTTLVSFTCNASSPRYAGQTVLLNPTRIFSIAGTTSSAIRYIINIGTNGVREMLRLTSDATGASVRAAVQQAFSIPSGLVRRVKVTIPSASLLGTDITNGVTLVPAMGAGFAYNVLAVATKASGTLTTVYTAGAAIAIKSAGAAQNQYSLPANVLTNGSAASKIGMAIPATVTGAQVLDQIVDNADIVAIAGSSFATGTFDLDVFVTYEIIALNL